MASFLSYRTVNLLVFLAVTALIGTGLYMEHQMELHPCALCMTQRIFFIVVGLIALTAFIINAKAWGKKLLGFGMSLFAIIGGGFSSRQLWLQSLPEDQVPACGPSLDYLVDNFPLSEVITTMIKGTGNCAEVVWTFLGLSIPGWALVWFAGFAITGIWQALRK